MMKLNTLNTIEKAKGKINPYYDLRWEDIAAITEASNGKFDIMCKLFVFGYAQGVKAQKKGKAYV